MNKKSKPEAEEIQVNSVMDDPLNFSKVANGIINLTENPTKAHLRDTISKRLKELRLKSGKSQAELCRSLTMIPMSYSNWETGKCEVPNVVLYQLARYYQVSLDYIYGLTDNPRGLYNVKTEEQSERISNTVEQLQKQIEELITIVNKPETKQ